MPMTGDHLRLLKAMGVPRLLVCINKCDLVSPDELLLLEESLLERVMDESGMVPDIVSVSAKTGANMAALHTAIVGQLGDMAEHHAPREQAAPRLYVDRVFTANGTGTVLTGTLQQGSLKVGDKLRLYPADREVQVRSLQAYHQSVDEIGAVCRVAVGACKLQAPGCHLRQAFSPRLLAMQSIRRSPMRVSKAALISRMQVGLVTLISVRWSPITSSPTKIRPFSRRVGPTAAAISRSRSVSGRASPRPPAARLPRVSPAAGMRARQ